MKKASFSNLHCLKKNLGALLPWFSTNIPNFTPKSFSFSQIHLETQ